MLHPPPEDNFLNILNCLLKKYKKTTLCMSVYYNLWQVFHNHSVTFMHTTVQQPMGMVNTCMCVQTVQSHYTWSRNFKVLSYSPMPSGSILSSKGLTSWDSCCMTASEKGHCTEGTSTIFWLNGAYCSVVSLLSAAGFSCSSSSMGSTP